MENSSPPVIPLISLPPAYASADVKRGMEQWNDAAGRESDTELGHWMRTVKENPVLSATLASIFGNSPYLTRSVLQYPKILHNFIMEGPDKTYADIISALQVNPRSEPPHAQLMRDLRIVKAHTALVVALADITKIWSLPQVTTALANLAERCLQSACNALLHRAHRRGNIHLTHADDPSKESGIIILGMGKLGGFELNYSSDIDLIIFYEPEKLRYSGRDTEQHFMTRLAHDLVTLLQERSREGYVFRTDLRLRPDPASTPPAITTNAAYYYYESVGQNWERAAMIKARPVAGDIAAGEQFLKGITPFMWRRNLDFAAINDIHSIKRQMDSKQGKTIQIKTHNIKLGKGGIREIEFYAQIHQLIWGGREPSLRIRGTCETLEQLATFGLIQVETKNTLLRSYVYLRTLEHRLQMVADEQTHSLPATDEGIIHIANFMGYSDKLNFESDLLTILNQVHAIYASSFTNNHIKKSRLGSAGNLVFTGTHHDPDTLLTLRTIGFSTPETVSEIVMGWHHGSARATRTKRARELLTELMPHLLGSLAATDYPDDAFLNFNEFLQGLPSGVQLFSLFNANPHLLHLIAQIMGTAPILAESLTKTPELLEAVLYQDFYNALPRAGALANQLQELLAGIRTHDNHSFEECLNRLRQFKNEKHFQAGVQLLKHLINGHEAGRFLSTLADTVIAQTLACAQAEFVKTYGVIPESQFAIIGLGKLGSKEMTFRSDIDLIFVYDVADFDTVSDGAKKFGASVYYNRLAQRFVQALTLLGKNGRLYEVDTRLRPSGAQGLLAVSLQALRHYFEDLAWTFEYMAFTKARVICAQEPLATTLTEFITQQLAKPRDTKKLCLDVGTMREKIATEHDSADPWDIKYARGGTMDIDFIAQYLLLLHAPTVSGATPGDARAIFDWLEKKGLMPADIAQHLLASEQLLSDLFHVVRLCYNQNFTENSVPMGLKKLLVEIAREKNFATLSKRLIQVERSVRDHYIALIET